MKLKKYGDRLLETIEATIKQHNNINKNSSSSNDSADSIKRRREAAKVSSNGTSNGDEDMMGSTGRSKKRVVAAGKTSEIKPMEVDVFSDCLDADLDYDDQVFEMQANNGLINPMGETNVNGRKLPVWPGQRKI